MRAFTFEHIRLLRRAALGLGLVLPIMEACSSPSEPSASPLTTVRVIVDTVAAPVLSQTPDGIQDLSCDVGLTASAAGRDTVRWIGATFRWYLGRDQTTPFDSADADAATIQSSWGTATITGGSVELAGWTFSASIPFTATIQFHYRNSYGGVASTDPVPFTLHASDSGQPCCADTEWCFGHSRGGERASRGFPHGTLHGSRSGWAVAEHCRALRRL